MNNDSKLFLYSQLKTQIKLEEYLLKETSFKNRQLLTKFRICDHSLKIEIGRYRNIPKEQRLCDNCKEINNEHHFFLHCNSNKILRDNLIEAFHKVIPSFKTDHPNIQIQHFLNPQFEL
jgi:hypothetical protein